MRATQPPRSPAARSTNTQEPGARRFSGSEGSGAPVLPVEAPPATAASPPTARAPLSDEGSHRPSPAQTAPPRPSRDGRVELRDQRNGARRGRTPRGLVMRRRCRRRLGRGGRLG